MASGMWPSVSGAVAQSQVVDVVANNLANADTSAFKKDLPTFKEYLTVLERLPNHVEIPRGPVKDRDLYPLDGRDQSFVIMDGTHTDHRQGPLTPTHGALDLGIEGRGFFQVLTPQGIRYTRQGAFKINGNGTLVNSAGFPVMASTAGAPRAPAQAGTPTGDLGRAINLADRTHLSVSEEGDIFSGEDLIAKIAVTDFGDYKKLKKEGGELFVPSDETNPPIASLPNSRVRQGFLERSNVNPVEEMVNLIKANRLFEHDLKAMKSYDEMMAKESNDIGKL